MFDTTLYRDQLLEHARAPRNAVPLCAPTAKYEAHNPLCGDRAVVELTIDGGRLTAVSARVRGCAIAKAAASMATQVWHHRRSDDALRLATAWLAALESEQADAPHLDPALEPTRPLLLLRGRPNRMRCAQLPWSALREALKP